mmetsp:Transcript_56043/g.99794  ORF Transcript_56043/g.99794 Transcript_56043/m.99794 type:complete len:237 (-) Transcript_56043:47-757(-)
MALVLKPEQTTLTPPARFGCVECNLWRSKTPTVANFPFLKTLRLKTIVCLASELPTRALRTFIDQNDISFLHLACKLWKPEPTWTPFCEELFKEGLEILLDNANYPILVFCSTGVLLTGTLVGLLRKSQSWCLNAILEEYRTYTKQATSDSTSTGSTQFIEDFDMDLISFSLPRAPEWYQHASNLELADEQYFAEFGLEPRGKAQYQRYYFPVADYPLLSNKSTYTKESVLDEDDD